MSKRTKNRGDEDEGYPGPIPFIGITVDYPQEHQFIPIPDTATGRTTVLYGAVVQSMSRRVNRTSNPPLYGPVVQITQHAADYSTWSTPLTANDCPTPGDYALCVTAIDQTSGQPFSCVRNFQAP